MKINEIILLLASWSLISACASKDKEMGQEIPPASSRPTLEPSKERKVLFGEVNILSEVTAGDGCSDSDGRSYETTEDFAAQLENEKLTVSQKELASARALINVVVQWMGLDRGQVRTTLASGGRSPELPIRFERRGNSGLTLHYLDKEIGLRASRQVPVYTFSAAEQRGACHVTHQVNVFLDRLAPYSLK